jgi:hypothetical protein
MQCCHGVQQIPRSFAGGGRICMAALLREPLRCGVPGPATHKLEKPIHVSRWGYADDFRCRRFAY